MSTNRTLVQLLAAEPVTAAEILDLRGDLVPVGPGPRELGVPISKRAQVVADKCADRRAALRGADPRLRQTLIDELDPEQLEHADQFRVVRIDRVALRLPQPILRRWWLEDGPVHDLIAET